MSVLYSLTLRRDYSTFKNRKSNSVNRFILLLLIAGFSFQGAFAQNEKEMQKKKEADMKNEEAAALEARMQTNPAFKARIEKLNQKTNNIQSTLSADENVKKASTQQLMLDEAKMKSERALGPQVLQGVSYKIITTGNKVEYVIINSGIEIYKHEINTAGSIYDRTVRAEKEALYAARAFRRNINYPTSTLQGEIDNQFNTSNANRSSSVIVANNTQRTTADYTFNGGGGTIPAGAPATTSGPADPYPSSITVSGVPLGSLVKSVQINGLSHTFPDDIDMVLQSPTGVNVILMSDAGGGSDIVNINLSFSDAAANTLDDGTQLVSGTYKPTNWGTGDNWVAPGPGTAPSAVTLSTFGNGSHNGTWKLFIVDDVGGDVGSWSDWSITFTDPPPVCFPINITGQPSNATICSGTNGSFAVTATPNGITYNWQVNTGSGFTYLSNGGVYSGANTATLNITGATITMNGYQYRCILTCTDGGLPEITNPATLTVLTSPTAPSVSPASPSICLGGNVALNITSSQSATSQTVSSASGLGLAVDNTLPPAVSTLNVAGFAGTIATIRVNFNITHTFDGDVRVNLQAPNGAIINLVNRKGGGGDNFTNTTISSASGVALTTGSAPFTGTFAADLASAVGTAPYVSTNTTWASLFSVPNGDWKLIVTDHAGGDNGTLDSWSITLLSPAPPDPAVWSPVTGLFNDAGLSSPYVAGTYQTTVYASPATTTTYSASVTNGTCNSLPTNVTVTVNTQPAITAQPTDATTCIGVAKTFSVTATGSNLTYQWQVDPNTGTFSNITGTSANNSSGFIYSGYNSNTLTVTTVLATMVNYKYRCIVSGTCTPAVTSNTATLTVNTLPTISVTNSAQCSPTTLTASGADTYSWSPSAGLSSTTGASVTANPTTNTIYIVTGTSTATGCFNTSRASVSFTPSAPVVSPAAPIICAGAVQPLSITSAVLSSTPPIPLSASSGTLNLIIPDNEPFDGLVSPPIAISGVTGAVQSISVTLNILHTWDADLDVNLVAPNGNVLNLIGARGGSGDNFTNTTISSTSTTSLGTSTAPFTGTFAADGLIGWGPVNTASNVSTFASLFSVPNGNWRLAIADFASPDEGTLVSWSITINYAAPDPGVWTPVTGLFSDAAGTIPYVAGTPAATVYASPASTTTYSVTVTNMSSSTVTFSTGGAVTIPGVAPSSSSSGPGTPYPSAISVTGIPTNAVVKSITLKGIRHSYPDDIDILLRAPSGDSVVLMSDCGGSADLTGQTFTFDDAGGPMSDGSLNATGTYHPTNYGATDVYPAPIGSITQASPALSLFTGNPNGTWNLYARDEFSGDVGGLTSWEITFALPTAANCTSPPRNVTVTVQAPIVFTTQPTNKSVCQNGSVTFTAAATGTITSTQWQVSTNGGTTWSNIAGATTTTLTLTNVQTSQNGYRYRLVLSSTGCGPTNSNAAILTVNPLPTVSLSLSPAGQTQLRPGLQTTVTVNSTPGGASYVWSLNGTVQPNITTSSYVVDAYHLGTYTVEVTDVNGCVNKTAGVTFTALATSQLFIYPNPTTGAYYVTYYMSHVGTPITISVFDMKGSRIVESSQTTTAPYTRFDFSASGLAAGVYVIEVRNSAGERLDHGRLVVTR